LTLSWEWFIVRLLSADATGTAGGWSDLKEVIEKILKAEQDAKRMVQEAREEARAIVDAARGRGLKIIEEARDDARAEAQTVLDRAREEADAERERILAEARARAGLVVDTANVEDLSLITGAVRRISGLEE
jgi:ATP synthase H subunit